MIFLEKIRKKFCIQERFQSVFTVWQLINKQDGSLVLEGDRCLWHWPWPNLRPFLKIYSLTGVFFFFPIIFLLVFTASVTYSDLQGNIQHTWRMSQIYCATALGGLYLLPPILWSLRKPILWEAHTGYIRIGLNEFWNYQGFRLVIQYHRQIHKHHENWNTSFTISVSMLNDRNKTVEMLIFTPNEYILNSIGKLSKVSGVPLEILKET